MSSLTSTEEKSLQALIRKVVGGEVALFMGAGASLSSGAPSGKELVDLIKEKFNDIDFEDIGYNLLDICQEIEENGRRVALERFIKKTFYGLKPSDSLSSIPRYSWPVIFTTNYDDLIEKAFEGYYNEHKETARVCKLTIRGDNLYTFNKKDDIFLFKLMGDAKREDDPNESPVLTRGDYTNRSPSRGKMLETLSRFVHEGAVLYIGYSFKDRVVIELIDELRKRFGNKMDDSFALAPNFERGSKIEKLIIKRNIRPIPLSFEEFMRELKKEPETISSIERRPTDITLKLKDEDIRIHYQDYKEFEEYFKILSEWEIQKGKIEEGLTERERIEAFLKGQSENWEAFEKGWDFKRDIYFKVKDVVEQEIKKNRPEANDAILVLGGGGLGKSILLKRLAFDIYEAGNPVIILNSYLSFFDYKLIDKFCQDVNPDPDKQHKVTIILDNAAANIDNVKKIAVYLKNHSKLAVVICAARPNEWIYAQNQWGFGKITSEDNTFIIPTKMDGREIMRLLEHLGRILNRKELSTNLEFWVEKALSDYESDFFAIIYRLMDPARRTLNEIIWDEYKKLPSEPTKRAYEYVCLFSQYDLPLKSEMIVEPLRKEFGYSYLEFANDICETEAKSLIIGMESDLTEDVFFRAKNQIIAQKIVEKLFDPTNKEQMEKMVERYTEILSKARALDRSEIELVRSLLVKYLGPNGIDKGKIDEEHLVKLYDALLNNGIEDSTILHHYGILESNRENFEKAEYLLNKSLKTSRRYRGGALGTEQEKNILNSLGVLYSKEALKYLSDDLDTALNLYDKADFYFRSSKMRDVTSPYPYHSGAYSSFKKGEYYDNIGLTEEAYNYYSEALEVIAEAKESISDYEIEAILSLESKIYSEKFGNFIKAKGMLQIFIDKAPHVVSGYIIMSRLIFNKAKRDLLLQGEAYENSFGYKKILGQTLSFVEKGLRVSKRNQDLLKLKYYILNDLEPDNIEKIYEILLERYKAFDGNCSELKLLFEIGVITFEQERYKESKAFFQELSEKCYDHPNRSGIKKVALDSKKKVRIFKGYISKFISRKEAYVSSEEIGYPIIFVPIAQKRELRHREDVRFKVAFNYRGALAIDLKPV